MSSQTITTTMTTTEAGSRGRGHKHELKQKASARWRRPESYKFTSTTKGKLNEDGTPKEARKFKNSVIARRNARHLQTGKGSIGIRVRRSRVKAQLQHHLAHKLVDYKDLLGADSLRGKNPFEDVEQGRWTIWKSFVTPTQAAYQATMVQLMAFAYSYARARHAESRMNGTAAAEDAEVKEEAVVEDVPEGAEGVKAKRVKKAKKHGVKLLVSDWHAAIHWFKKLKTE